MENTFYRMDGMRDAKHTVKRIFQAHPRSEEVLGKYVLPYGWHARCETYDETYFPGTPAISRGVTIGVTIRGDLGNEASSGSASCGAAAMNGLSCMPWLEGAVGLCATAVWSSGMILA